MEPPGRLMEGRSGSLDTLDGTKADRGREVKFRPFSGRREGEGRGAGDGGSPSPAPLIDVGKGGEGRGTGPLIAGNGE